MSWFELVLLFLTVMKSVPIEVVCNNLPDIYWNSSNPIFRIDNTDHIIDVNIGNTQFEYDQVNLICPVYDNDTIEEEQEKSIIYNVNKEEYDTCRITNPSPRVIAVCDKPTKLMYFTITFRSFTPQPGGLEFHPGRDYYFISTSSKDDLHRRMGGLCTTNHRKLVFKVCCDSSAQPSHDQANNRISITDSREQNRNKNKGVKNEELTHSFSPSINYLPSFRTVLTSFMLYLWIHSFITNIPVRVQD